MGKRILSTIGWLAGIALLIFAGLYARTVLGGEVGDPCSDFVLSCRATRGMFTMNGCVRAGPGDADTFCSYECESASDCPGGWSCDPGAAWSNVPGAIDEHARHICTRPR